MWSHHTSFRPLAGISCNYIATDNTSCLSCWFPSPYGENPLSHGLRRASSPDGGSFRSCRYPVLSSPFGRAGAQRLRGFCGDKLKSLLSFSCQRLQSSFRPLTGISCNALSDGFDVDYHTLPSPCGDKLHNTKLLYLFLPQKKRTFSGKRPDSGVRSGKPGGRQKRP